MQRILCTAFFLFTSALLLAQNAQLIDSLTKQASLKTGKEQFEILSNLAWEYRLVNPDSTIQIGKRAYELGKKLEVGTGLSRPLNFIGVGYEYKVMSVDAYTYFMQALTTASNQNDAVQIAYSSNNLGRLFLDQGNVSKALEAHQTALSIFESREDLAGMASVHLSLAQYYHTQKEFKKAEEFYLKVIDTRIKLEKGPNISSLNEIGIFYREIGNLKKANYYLLKADSLCEARNNEVLRANINFQLAMTRLLEEKYDEAEAFAKKSINYSLPKGINTRRVYNVLGKIKFQQGNYAKAKENFNTVLAGSKTFKDSDIRMDAYFHLANIYEKEGAYDKQLFNKNLFLTLKDSLSGIELNKQIERLKFQFNLELEQKKIENNLLRTLDSKNNVIIKKQQTINTIYLVALGVIVLISVLLFRNASIKNKLNVELEKRQDKILRQSGELKAINLEIEKINSNLEKIVEERTKTIKAKNKLLTEYAYFNSHQIRGPLARILGLIQVMNLEFKDAFGSHINMLEQAGSDLDAAIHQINKLIDDVSERYDET